MSAACSFDWLLSCVGEKEEEERSHFEHNELRADGVHSELYTKLINL